MNRQVITADEVTFDQLLNLARQLRPLNQFRLLARLAAKIDEVQQATWATVAL